MLNVTWWRSPEGMNNLGDEITSILLENHFQVEHSKTNIFNADVISTGSILNWVYNRDDWKPGRRRLAVVGSGLMKPVANIEKKNKANDFLDIHSVRGYLTKSLLGAKGNDVSIGDPGLLASLLVSTKPAKKFKFGVIPHHTKVDDVAFINKFSALGDICVIDFRTNDHHAIFTQMLECEVILSQSLHGLIFSDSLGIPNVWVDSGTLHGGGEFKFYDYFSSIGRDFSRKLDVSQSDAQTSMLQDSKIHEMSQLKLREVQSDIIAAFKKVI
ncbi:polysaccharide pyruvyl transferase family protein [Cobetia sp. L2A1]|uniref:polysaccharide pyruvyl transferase family protein n=1 Tax=Cobetia sp. L2A1 TaxID=2686360 RepID=UPI00131D0554|nr:polysaccharide pyruvyl transferase family protein [Cobetia sp. L2A1]